jgi:hypothetical protein
MAVTLNASTSSGLVSTADTSGIITLQNNGTNALTVTSGNLQFNSGYGSVATAYGCRAWVNFNGTGTPAIRASGNVTSITDNNTGDYTVNITTAMPDVNYCVASVCTLSDAIVAGNTNRGFSPRSYTTTTVRLLVTDGASGVDPLLCNVAIFR